MAEASKLLVAGGGAGWASLCATAGAGAIAKLPASIRKGTKRIEFIERSLYLLAVRLRDGESQNRSASFLHAVSLRSLSRRDWQRGRLGVTRTLPAKTARASRFATLHLRLPCTWIKYNLNRRWTNAAEREAGGFFSKCGPVNLRT